MYSEERLKQICYVQMRFSLPFKVFEGIKPKRVRTPELFGCAHIFEVVRHAIQHVTMVY
jgi:hypothetical protein